MKQSIFFILLVFSAWKVQAQCNHNYTEVCASFTALHEEEKPLIPNNLSSIFAGEIAGKIAMETGAFITTAALAPALFSPLFPLATAGMAILPAVGIGTNAATNASQAYNYEINNWAPYLEYGESNQRETVKQKIDFRVDVIKADGNNTDRFIAIDADIRLDAANEYEETQTTVRRSKFMDLYTFKIKPNNATKAKIHKSIPLAENKDNNYSHTLSISVDGGASIAKDPSVGANASFGYSVTSSSNIKDFEILNDDKAGQQTEWTYRMRNAYDPVNSSISSVYQKPTDLIINGVLTKWLRRPADLAIGNNELRLVCLYRIDANESAPIEFEFESVQQLMHLEVVGRWGAEGAKMSGIGVAVPYYTVISGKIIVTPNPTDPSKTTITREITKASYTYPQFVDQVMNKPLNKLQPPILSSGCYAISNAIDLPNKKNYITHGGGAGVVNYYANRQEAKEWEKINIVYAGKSRDGSNKDVYGFYTQDQRFMQAVHGDAVWKSPHLGDWEKWELVPIGDGKYNIKNVGHNRYLGANYGALGFGGTLGTAATPGDWEKWIIEPQSGGCAVSPIKPLPYEPPAPAKTETVQNDFYSFSVGEQAPSQNPGGNPGGENPAGPTVIDLSPAQHSMLDQRAQSFSPQTNIATPGHITQNLQAMTIEAWVKNDGGPENIQAIVSSANLDFAHLQASDDANVKCAVYVNNGEVYLPAVPKNPGIWQHVALVVQSGNSQLYINGTPYGAKDSRTFSSIKPAANILIGKGLGNGRPFNGKIANVRIWNSAKTQAEVASAAASFDFNTGAGLLYHSPTTNALTIASAADCVAIPAAVTSGLQSLTVEAWVKNDSPQTDIQAIVSATGPEFVHLQLSADGNVNNAVYLSDGRSIMLPVIPKLAPGWHHVALVVESGNSRVYLNGQQVGAADPTTFSGIKPASSVFVGKGWSGDRVFKGQIADVRIWKNRPLTQSQLETYRHTPPPANAAGLAFYR